MNGRDPDLDPDAPTAETPAETEVQQWQRIADERAEEIDRLSARLRRLEAGGGSSRAPAPETGVRVAIWVLTIIVVSVLGRVLGYDQDAVSAVWFITVAAVVTTAMVLLGRRR